MNTRYAIGLFLVLVSAPLAAVEPEGIPFFESKVRPLLLDRCIDCHGPDRQKGGLRLDSRDGWMTGGGRGPAIVPGKPDESLLLKAVRFGDKDLQMPPKDKGGPLPPAAVESLVQWIRMGAPDPRTNAPSPAASSTITTRGRVWWAFQPPRLPSVPPTGDPNPVDAFIHEGLAAHGLQPSAAADRRVLLRRATFDLTGLPPTPEAMANFLADTAPDAFARVVDRLLASPAYGERWTRHWLDVARYADYHDAEPKARVASCEPLEAWRYRDWVVESFNRDLPFNRFITHQIAGDLIPQPAGVEDREVGQVATAFLVNGTWDRGDADKEKMVSDMVDDQIDTVGKAFLGLTFGCARCHDHKFDPVSNRDYYALAGIFYSTHIMENLGTKGGEITLKRAPLVPRAIASRRDRYVLQLDSIKAKLAALDKLSPPIATNHPERLLLIQERDAIEAEMPPPYPAMLTVAESGMPGGLFPNIQDVPIHIRGSYTRLGAVVPRAMPAFFAGTNQPPITRESGRRELAAWIASPTNPLTARVIVNRVWQWHFGEGLVRTPNNLGMTSEQPSHPALLDWLAVRFVQDGWSLKALHRHIMLSQAYQRSSRASPEQVSRDPENRWLARFSGRRLEAESIRDALLQVSGILDLTLGGPAGPDIASPRRSIYVQTARWDRSNFATLFDAANPDASVDRRTTSTVAPQALFLVNHGFMRTLAGRLADRIRLEPAGDPAARIDWTYQLLYARHPLPREVDVGRRLLDRFGGPAEQDAWREYAHVLLSGNEFIYID